MFQSNRAFSMIELIFVIVILGILAIVALPKFTATRDDAKVSTMARAVSTAASEIAGHAVATASVPSNLSLASNVISSLVNNGQATVGNLWVNFKMGNDSNCIRFVVDNGVNDANLTLITPGSTDPLCQQLESMFDPTEYPIPLKGVKVTY